MAYAPVGQMESYGDGGDALPGRNMPYATVSTDVIMPACLPILFFNSCYRQPREPAGGPGLTLPSAAQSLYRSEEMTYLQLVISREDLDWGQGQGQG